MMQKVRAITAGGCLQVENDSTTVVGAATCQQHATAGCDCCTVLTGWVR